jgi:hypothetical protein
VRERGRVQADLFFVARNTEGNGVVVGYWASGGVITVGHNHCERGGFHLVVGQDVHREISIDATGLATTV